jgi:cysteine desulfurase
LSTEDRAPGRIYLDHAATAPLAPPAREAMLPWLRGEVAANPSSLHRSGQRARAAVEEARERLAEALGARPAELVFTSGATEADALAVHGTLAALPSDAALVVSAAEHAAVLEAARAEEARGRPVLRLAPGPTGAPSPADLDGALADVPGPVGLVAAMHTNNETGALADLPALADVVHRHGGLLLCDAVQAFGMAPLDARALGVDLLTVSSHKIGGPQGAGALWIRDGVEVVPQLRGGAQERGRRAGSHAVAALVGFGAAARAAGRDVAARAEAVAALRDRLEVALTALPGVRRNGSGPRGPKHLNVRVEGVDGEALLIALDDAGVEASAGSACAAGSLEPSHVLLAMGLPRAEAKASLRFSLGPGTTEAEVDGAADRTAAAISRLRALPAETLGPL